ADMDAEPRVGPLRRRGPPRVDRVELGAVPYALEHVVEEDRVRFARVGTPQDEQVGVFRLPIGAGATTSSEHRRQTDDARSVSSSVAAVDVVAAHHGPGELLGHVVHLVRGLRAAEHAERLSPVPLSGGREPGRRAVKGLVPGRRAQRPVVTDKRLRQPYLLAHQAHLPDGQLRPNHFTFGVESRSTPPRADFGAWRIPAAGPLPGYIVLRSKWLTVCCVRTLSEKRRRGGGRALLSGRTARRRVQKISLPYDGRADGTAAHADFLASEEPLGIRVDGTALTMTMRTPGDDIELAAGFLVSEAVVRGPADIAEIKICDGTSCGHAGHDGMGNIADVILAPGVTIGPSARRNFLTTSACGICGKASIADICVMPHAPLAADP